MFHQRLLTRRFLAGCVLLLMLHGAWAANPPVNTPPTMTSVSSLTINEDTSAGPLSFTVGDAETPVGNLIVTATSSNTALVPNGNISLGGTNPNRTVTVTPVANAVGQTTITLRVRDTGLDGVQNNGDDATTTRSFTVTVSEVNDPPVINGISSFSINEDAGNQSVSLSGIAAGGGESQTLSVSASSSNTGLIPTPSVSYTSANSTGSLSFTPVANASGSATITVTVSDSGGASTSTSFTVTVNSVNDIPTINGIGSLNINEDAGSQSVGFSGVTAGGGESQSLSVSASSSNTGLIPTPSVSYTSANSAGSLSFTPVSDASGSATITVTVSDSGGASTSTSFTVTVNSVNDIPTINGIGSLNINEDAGSQSVSLSGITAGGGESQTLSVSASSSNTGLIPTPLVSYTSANTTGSLSFAPVANASGSATITVTVSDSGGASTSTSFTVTVSSINDPPTINGIGSFSINEDAGSQSVSLSGITAGGGESQTLSVSASSSNTGLIPTPTVGYTSANTTGSLSFTPVSNASGSATITVTVSDSGGASTSTSFTVTVNFIEDPPTINGISSFSINEDAGAQNISLSGITAGGGESQTISVSASSSNTGLIPAPSISYASPNTTGSLSFTPSANASGSSTITITVSDSGGSTTSTSFTVTVNAINDLPTINSISNLALSEDAAAQTVSFAGITAGGGESQTLSVSASSSNTGLIPNPSVSYTSANLTGSLSFTPVANASGAATITVVIRDAGFNGVLNDGDDATSSTSFTVTVNAVNDAPTISGISNLTLNEDAGGQTVTLSGITAGGGESQTLSVSASSSNTGLVPTPAISYTSANSTGTLSFTPVANASGSSTITVTVRDAGLNGILNDADDGTASNSFTVTVNASNDAPTITSVSNQTINEDSATAALVFTVGDLETAAASLVVSAASSNTSLVPAGNIALGGSGSSRTVTVTPIGNQSGSSTITLTVRDTGLNGIAGDVDDATTSTSFTLTVNPVNDLPTISSIANVSINEDAGAQTVSLGGITAGGGESQTLSVTASSSNTSVVPTPTASYTSPNSTGSLSFTPVANASGSATITVAVRDAGLNGILNDADDGTASTTFTVTVSAINDLPTISGISNLTISEDAGAQTVSLAGITAGGGESQALAVSASSSNTGLIPTPSVSYSSPNLTGSLSFTPVANANGASTITVTVRDAGFNGTLNDGDDGVLSTTFTVAVNAVNDSPIVTLTAAATSFIEGSSAILVDSSGTVADVDSPDFNGGTLTVDFSVNGMSEDRLGIRNQGTLSGQIGISSTTNVMYGGTIIGNFTGGIGTTPLVINLNSNATPAAVQALVQNITYDNVQSSNPSTPSRTVRMVLTDGDGGTSAAAARTVNIISVNDTPTITNIADQTINEDSATAALAFTIGDEETPAASLTLSRNSSNTTLVPLANIVFGGSGANRTVTVTPAANQSGTATITVTVTDGNSAAAQDTFVLTVVGQVAAPSLSLSFNSDHSIATVTGTSQAGATVRYTTDGTDPTSSSSTTAPSFGVATTVKARAFQSGFPTSDVATMAVTVSSGVSFSPNGHSPIEYSNGPLAVQMNAEAGATIFYKAGASGSWLSTSHGSSPSIDGIDSGNGTIQAYAYTATKLRSATATSQEFSLRLPQPTSTVSYNSSFTSGTLTLNALSGATIRYSTDGTEPTAASTAYASPLTYSTATRVFARAYKAGYVPSGYISTWVNQLPAPKIATTSGVLTSNITVNNPIDIWFVPNFGFDNVYGENRNNSGWNNGLVQYTNDAPNANYPGAIRAPTAFTDLQSLSTVKISHGRTYTLAGWFKSYSGVSKDFAGLANFDKDGNPFYHHHVNELQRHITYLTQPLNNGATTAYLANEQIFSPIGSEWYMNRFVPLRNFERTGPIQKANQPNGLKDIFQLDDVAFLEVTNVDSVTKSVRLKNAYSGTTLPVGTVIARRENGGWYQYQLLGANSTPTNWTRYSTTFSYMRAGTEQIKLLALLSRDGGFSEITGFEFWEGGTNDRPNLYYTLDGNSAVYSQSPASGPVKLTLDGNHQGNIRLGQRGTFYIDAPLAQRTISFIVAAPVVNAAPAGGSQVTLTVTTGTSGAQIRYTTDGTEPTTSSTLYSSPVTVANTTTTKWKAFKANYTNSDTTTYSASQSGDSDNDGLPDAWEQLYFGNLNQNGNTDFDADGWTNLQEYLAGTHPASGQSFQVFTPLR